MAQVPIVPFALPYAQVPGGFEYPTYAVSEISATEAFNTDIDIRDEGVCVVCGFSSPRHAHIIPQVENKIVSASFVCVSLEILSSFVLLVGRLAKPGLDPSRSKGRRPRGTKRTITLPESSRTLRQADVLYSLAT